MIHKIRRGIRDPEHAPDVNDLIKANPIYRRAENNAQKRADWFTSFNRECMAKGCRIISSPGASDVIIECLPGDPWPEELKARGFPLRPEPDGTRIVPYATRQEMTQNADGTLAPITEGSTQPTTMIVHQPGIRQTARFTMLAPF